MRPLENAVRGWGAGRFLRSGRPPLCCLFPSPGQARTRRENGKTGRRLEAASCRSRAPCQTQARLHAGLRLAAQERRLRFPPADQRGATVWQRRRARCPQSALHPATLAGMRSSEGCHGKQEGFLKAGRTVAAVRQSGLAKRQAVLCRLIAGSFFGLCRHGACAWIRVALELLRQAVYTYSVEMHNLPLGCRAESDRLAWRTLWRASYRQGYSLF